MPLRAVVAVEQSVIKALQRAIWTVLRMLLHAKCPSFGKPALWSTSRVLRSILAVSGWRAAQVDDNSDVLGDLTAARVDKLRPGVRGKRMFLTPFYIFIFAFFGGKAVLSSFFFFFFYPHNWVWKWGIVLPRVLLTPLDDRLPICSTAVKVTLIAVKKRFYLYL